MIIVWISPTCLDPLLIKNKEWKKLSPETRARIQAQRKANKEQRTVSKTVSFRDEPEVFEESAKKPTGNGGQFGSGAYNNKKKKKAEKED